MGILCAALLAGAAFPLIAEVWSGGRAVFGFGLGAAGTARLAREWEAAVGSVLIPPGSEGDSLLERIDERTLRIDGSCFASGEESVFSISDGFLAISRGGVPVFRSELPVSGIEVWRAGEGRPIGLALTLKPGAAGGEDRLRALFGFSGLLRRRE